VPIQVTDSYGQLVKAAQGTLGSLLYGELYQRSYLRPLMWGHIRVVHDLAGGNDYLWFRGWHVAQVAVLALLFVRILKPRRWQDAAVVPLGLAALFAGHTFAGTIREAFPINTFMTILLCCFAAAAVSLGPPRWWRDVAAAALFVFAALTVESGLLVAVVVVAAWIAGARGVSTGGVAAQVGLVAGYFVLRFGILHTGSPELVERTSGFLFSNLDPQELVERFGANPWPFYLYNVATSIVSVFLAEPRGGVFLTTRTVLEGVWTGPGVVNVIASSLGTAFIAWFLWRRRHALLARATDRRDQIVVVCIAVTLANAAISYAYTKDVILSPAGAFYALALAAAVACALDVARTAPTGRVAAMVVVLGLLGSTWAVRSVGAHLGLRAAASAMRAEWVYVDLWLERKGEVPTEPFAIRMKQQLHDDAVYRHPLRAALVGDWVEWFSGE
jgi:hypothetical protein